MTMDQAIGILALITLVEMMVSVGLGTSFGISWRPPRTRG